MRKSKCPPAAASARWDAEFVAWSLALRVPCISSSWSSTCKRRAIPNQRETRVKHNETTRSKARRKQRKVKQCEVNMKQVTKTHQRVGKQTKPCWYYGPKKGKRAKQRSWWANFLRALFGYWQVARLACLSFGVRKESAMQWTAKCTHTSQTKYPRKWVYIKFMRRLITIVLTDYKNWKAFVRSSRKIRLQVWLRLTIAERGGERILTIANAVATVSWLILISSSEAIGFLFIFNKVSL